VLTNLKVFHLEKCQRESSVISIDMNTYKKRTPARIYRKIYEQHNGPIPKDSDGRTFDIHHIDGDDSNNDPQNLVALSIKDHYDVHYRQGDWTSCMAIEMRMRLSPNLFTELNLQRVKDGTHPWVGDGSHQRKIQQDKLENSTHHFMKRPDGTSMSSDRMRDGTSKFLDAEWQKEKARKSVENGTNNLLTRPDGTNLQTDRIANGTHNLIGEDSPTQVKWKCPHCETEGKSLANYKRWHGDKCKNKMDQQTEKSVDNNLQI